MDGGALIYILIFVVLAVLQGLGQKRREAERKSRPRPEGGLPAPGSKGGEARPLPQPRRRTAPESSEGMIPSEVWEEILGLARGKPSSSTPAEAPPRPKAPSVGVPVEEIPPSEARSLEELEPRARKTRVDKTGAGKAASSKLAPRVGSTTSSKPVSPSGEALPQGRAIPASSARRRSLAARGRRMRKGLLGSGSAEELRRAMVLSEVLGPPQSLRE